MLGEPCLTIIHVTIGLISGKKTNKVVITRKKEESRYRGAKPTEMVGTRQPKWRVDLKDHQHQDESAISPNPAWIISISSCLELSRSIRLEIGESGGW